MNGLEMMDNKQAEKDWMKALGMKDDDNCSEYDGKKESVGDEETTNDDDDEALSVYGGK